MTRELPEVPDKIFHENELHVCPIKPLKRCLVLGSVLGVVYNCEQESLEQALIYYIKELKYMLFYLLQVDIKKINMADKFVTWIYVECDSAGIAVGEAVS